MNALFFTVEWTILITSKLSLIKKNNGNQVQ